MPTTKIYEQHLQQQTTISHMIPLLLSVFLSKVNPGHIYIPQTGCDAIMGAEGAICRKEMFGW